MSDFPVGNAVSVNGARFDLFGTAFDFSDAVFLDMLLYLQNTDQALSSKLKEIRQLEATKEQLTHKLELLQKALRSSSAKADDDFVYVYGGTLEPGDPAQSPYAGQPEKQHAREKEMNLLANFRAINDQKAQEQGFYRKKQVEAEIESVRNALEQLNSSSQIFMIDLQRLLGQRNQAVEMTSNIIAKEERTNRGVIENLK